jgi:hypothetical protein
VFAFNRYSKSGDEDIIRKNVNVSYEILKKEMLSLPFYRSIIRLHCSTMWRTEKETFRSNSP